MIKHAECWTDHTQIFLPFVQSTRAPEKDINITIKTPYPCSKPALSTSIAPGLRALLQQPLCRHAGAHQHQQ